MSTETLERFPLTSQQNRAWLLQSHGSRTEAVAEISIEGDVDTDALREAIEILVQRHEILRTTYLATPSNDLVQVIREQVNCWAPETDREKGHLVSEIQSGTPTTKVLRLECPVLSADRTTFIEFLHQLAKAYEQIKTSTGDESEVFQYADYGQWQIDLREDGQRQAGSQFWRQAVEAEESEFRLPLEKRQREGKFSPKEILFDLSAGQTEALKRAALDFGTSSEEVALAVWACLVARIASSPACSIGVASKGRTHEELEGALGLYDRYLPVRFVNTEGVTLRRASGEIQKLLRSSRRHSDYFSWRKGDRELLQPLLFAWHSPVERVTSAGVTFRLQFVDALSEPFKVKIEFQELEQGTRVNLLYDSSCVSLTEANFLRERFLVLLDDAIQAPDQPLQDLKLVGPEEERVLRTLAWSSPPGKVRPVLELFSNAVGRHPDRVAVTCAGQSLTYRELNDRANQLANHLRTLGVTEGNAVGLSAIRSVELVVGIVGILKAGGAYVPLDPSYPKERLEFMVKDAGIQILVTHPELTAKLPAEGLTCVHLGSEALNAESQSEPERHVSREQLAYIIYTSGSTGQPKGVMIQHGHLAISTAARLEYYSEPVGNYLLLSSFSFDSSIAGIFWTLGSAGTLTLPAEGSHQDPGEILKLIASGRVSHLLALPSFYGAILDRSSPEQLTSLSTVIVAGEACHPQLLEQHSAKVGRAALYNEYGPTEGTVWSTVHRCTPGKEGDVIPIGRPVPGMGIYILDGTGKLAGLGVAGEICISGPTLAAGYLNRPELTKERFIRSGFDEGQRLYRTGDLGRFLENGNIEFLGRTDHQVKIRGYRIEMGEIEQLMRKHPLVREAVVIAPENGPGDKRLIGYIVPKQKNGFLGGEIKASLQEKLPSFMVPAVVVELDRMPLTPNGKLDRKALPAPTVSRTGAVEHPPQGPEEELLAKIWAELLKLERVGRNDNFFELGGHSLLALQMLARVRDRIKVELPLRTVFEKPTLESLGAVLAQKKRQSNAAATGQIKRMRRQAVSRQVLEDWEGAAEASAKVIQTEGKGD